MFRNNYSYIRVPFWREFSLREVPACLLAVPATLLMTPRHCERRKITTIVKICFGITIQLHDSDGFILGDNFCTWTVCDNCNVIWYYLGILIP